MPSVKQKTHKGTKKRFKFSANGKVLHKPCGSSHLMSHKSGKKVRRLRRSKVVERNAVSARLRRSQGNERLWTRSVTTPPAELPEALIQALIEGDTSEESSPE